MKTISSRERLEAALERISDPKGEGRRACLTVYAEAARAAADAADARARCGVTLGPLDGAIVTIKDLFDVAGEPTRAGSKILADAPPAREDAPVVRRLRAAGAVIVAKTNMTEFAFSGVGANPHYGTPGNPRDRTRVPGGSSSGAGVAAADGMCEIAIGSDTGGSTRIPAALCGVVGFKPSKWRVPTEGAFPLSYTLDSIGPLARTVEACFHADAVMAGEEPEPLEPAPLAGLRLAVPRNPAFTEPDETVAKAFADGLERLRKAGARIGDTPFPFLEEMLAANPKGGFPVPEAYSIHRERLAARGEDFDPNVRTRVSRGASITAADYIDLIQIRNRLVDEIDAWIEDFDALLLPTTPIVAPTLAEMQDPETFARKNATLLSNTSIVNFFDLCAISLPLPTAGLAVGLMLIARNGEDHRLFRIARATEQVLSA
ncbi:MAG TPA: amidase [Xanthobacteraceae bacterium]|nr:amidase [Xanthobacteraceae bacterium]